MFPFPLNIKIFLCQQMLELFGRWINHNVSHRKHVAVAYLAKLAEAVSSTTLQNALDDGMEDVPECKAILEGMIGIKTKTMSLQSAFEIVMERVEVYRGTDMIGLASLYISDNFTHLSKQREFMDETTEECLEGYLEAFYFTSTSTKSVADRKVSFCYTTRETYEK